MYKRSSRSISDEQSLASSTPAEPSCSSQAADSITVAADSMTPAVGMELLRRSRLSLFHSRTFYKASILIFTFAAYSSYHISRRPLSIVKSVLNKNCSSLEPPSWITITNETADGWCDWERK